MPANLHVLAHAKHVLRGLAPCHVGIQNIQRASHCTALYLPNIRTHFTSANLNPPVAQPSHHHSLIPHSPPPHGSLPHPLRTPAASTVVHVAAPPRSLHSPHHRCDCRPACHVNTHVQQPVIIHQQTHHTRCTYNAHNLSKPHHALPHTHACKPTLLSPRQTGP
jgi:hypothetical protein